jgi:hypothetical protein
MLRNVHPTQRYGAFALLLPLDFMFVNAVFAFSFINSEKKRIERARSSMIKFGPD